MREIKNGERYVVLAKGIIMGSFRISKEKGAWQDTDSNKFYLYDLFIDREYAGLGIGQICLDRAAELTRTLGGAVLRLDCWAGNETLKSLYSQTFHHCGNVREKEYLVSLYERDVYA